MGERYDVIVGGGLAGLSAALALQEAGDDGWLVLEKEDSPGGHSRSIVRDGYVFDFGPHILFTVDGEVERLILETLGDNLRVQERQAFIYHHAFRRYTRFPFQAHLHGLPVELVRDCLVGLVRAVEAAAVDGNEPANYEEWMRRTFGDPIAERLLIPYARKLWTVEPSSMDYNWIGRRVPTPDVARIVTGALTDDVAQVGATANFWYPWHGGIEALARGLAARVRGLQLRRELKTIDVHRRVLTLADGEELSFGGMVFTLPLCALPRWVPDLPPSVRAACRRLVYQGICNINLGVERAALSDMHWVYFYEDEFPFHRLSFPANFSPHNVPAGRSSISTEVAFSPARPFDRSRAVDDTIAALVRAEILEDSDAVEVVDVQDISPAYVVYDLDHGRNVSLIVEWLRANGIWPAGRFGEWQYFNMDHAIRSGMSAARAMHAERSSS